MLFIVGVIVLLVAAILAIVGVLSNAGAGHPLTDFSVFGSPHGVDRHVVPLWDRGRRGGVARTLPPAGGRAAYREPRSRGM